MKRSAIERALHHVMKIRWQRRKLKKLRRRGQHHHAWLKKIARENARETNGGMLQWTDGELRVR